MADDNQTLPPQKQAEPGKEGLMNPRPQYRGEDYKAAGKLAGKVAIITGVPFTILLLLMAVSLYRGVAEEFMPAHEGGRRQPAGHAHGGEPDQ